MGGFKAVVFDWAGTIVDFGSFAPMAAFMEAFGRFQVTVTVAEARAPMGLPKRAHIRAMLDAPRIAEAWRAVRGAAPDEDDVEALLKVFVPLNAAAAARHAVIVPGGLAAIADLRSRGLKIGSTSGYTRAIMDAVCPVAAAAGYTPENVVCSDDVIESRPGPLAMYKCFVDLGVYPPAAVIKVDDTEPGIAEGVAAGCVTVGVALSGNYMAKSPEEITAMSPAEIAPLRAAATRRLYEAGADHVVDTVADLPALIDRIDPPSRTA